MRISDWSSDVCSSDLPCGSRRLFQRLLPRQGQVLMESTVMTTIAEHIRATLPWGVALSVACGSHGTIKTTCPATCLGRFSARLDFGHDPWRTRSEERRVGKECVSKCRSRWWPDH